MEQTIVSMSEQPEKSGLTRRNFLRSGATLATAAMASSCGQKPDSPGGFEDLFKRTVRTSKISSSAGAFLLDSLEQEVSLSEISVAVWEHLEPEQVPVSFWTGKVQLDEDGLRRLLAAAIRSDFETGKIQQLDNWYLSETECLLSAARSLLEKEDPALVDRHPAELVPGLFCQVSQWGPQQTERGQRFNPQPDGSSAIWLQIDEAPVDTSVMLGDRLLRTTVAPGLITGDLTADVAPQVLDVPGVYEIFLTSRIKGMRQLVGFFHVNGRPSPGVTPPPLNTRLTDFEDGELVRVEAWGPQIIKQGIPFNQQPNGDSTLWLRAPVGSHRNWVVLLNEIPLITVVGPELISATVSPVSFNQSIGQTGKYSVYIIDLSSHVKQFVGDLEVTTQ